MLRLDLQKKARWIDLGHGVSVEVEPLTTGIMAAARRDPAVAAVFKRNSVPHPILRLWRAALSPPGRASVTLTAMRST